LGEHRALLDGFSDFRDLPIPGSTLGRSQSRILLVSSRRVGSYGLAGCRSERFDVPGELLQ